MRKFVLIMRLKFSLLNASPHSLSIKERIDFLLEEAVAPERLKISAERRLA